MSGQPRPDFVILGVPNPDGGVLIVASKELSQAELESTADELDMWEVGRRLRMSRTTYTLTAQMRSIHMVIGPDYGSALRTLFEQWTPPTEAGRRGIAAPVRPLDSVGPLAIEAGDPR